MSKYFICKCEERSKPIQDRKWVILEHMFNSCPFVKKPGVPSRWSTVKCLSCGAIGRTRGKYVYDLELINTGLKYTKTSKLNVPKFVRFVAVDTDGTVKGFESRPYLTYMGEWHSSHQNYLIGKSEPPFSCTVYLYQRNEVIK